MRIGIRRIGANLVKLSALLSLLTGCAKKPPPEPGVSVRLHYPVLLTDQRRLVVKEDEISLTTSSAATGLNYPEFTLLDSGGAQYSVEKVTEFGKKPVWLDMGTSRFRVFLELRAKGKPGLDKVKAMVKAVATGTGDLQNPKAAQEAVDGADSFPRLIEVCRDSWQWR